MQQQKLLCGPWFGALKACVSTRPLLRGGVFRRHRLGPINVERILTIKNPGSRNSGFPLYGESSPLQLRIGLRRAPTFPNLCFVDYTRVGRIGHWKDPLYGSLCSVQTKRSRPEQTPLAALAALWVSLFRLSERP